MAPTAGDGRGPGPERAFAPALGERVVLDPAESRHLVRSRRARPGDPVVLFDGRGGSVAGVLETVDPRAAVVRTTGVAPDREPARRVRVATALPDPGRLDRMLAGLAEIGVAEVAWLEGERSRAGAGDLVARRRGRWERLCCEAAKSNGRSRYPVLAAEGAGLDAFLAAADGPFRLLDPDPALPGLLETVPADGPLPWVLVGPAGGWTSGEVRRSEARGAVRARLGQTVLRVDTAALAAAAIMAAVA